MSEDSEITALLARIAAQDKAAFEALYRRLEKPVFRFVTLKLNDPHQAADVLHEVFMEIWRNAGRFEGRSAAKSWIFGIAYRKAIDVFRKTAKLDVTDDLPEQIDESPDGEACAMAAEQSVHVRACLDELSLPHRQAVELAFYEDLGYREISDITDVPENTVKTRIFHAKKLLMRCLEKRLVTGADG